MEPSDLTSGPREIGSLTSQSNDESQFVGSSSGVFFINTVRQAFSQNLDQLGGASSAQGFPQPEDTLLGSDASPHEKCSAPSSAKVSPSVTDSHSSRCQWEYDPTVAAVLGIAPPVDTARQLMMVYFKVWHPLFPFLHGPTFLQAMELLYSDGNQDVAAPPSLEHRSACWTAIFQCVFNLASHLHPDIHLPPESRIGSPSSMHALLGTLTSRNDLPSLQALLASQLYLVAKMSLRTASTVGGCMLRSMLHAGLHRCPFRYRELSSHDRQLRKRIFWSAYAIDRYLSQALGLPLGIQDSDIDVCAPGLHEVHTPGTYSREWPSFLPPSRDHHAGNSPMSPLTENPNRPHTMEDSDSQRGKRELAFASYVESGKLTGQALELFHKSILVRSVRRSSVLFLVTDVHKWWNSLSIDLQGVAATSPTSESPFNFGPFFTVLYQHLILLIKRPSLSLSPSTPEFGSALQTCIGAAREILAALKTQVDAGQALFWPGFLSAAWMAGLVLAFACQLRQYVIAKASQEITKCLDFLHLMSTQWETAKHCHRALTLLLQNIRHQFSTDPITRPSLLQTLISPHDQSHPANHNITTESRKRRRPVPFSPAIIGDTSLRPETGVPPSTPNLRHESTARNGGVGLSDTPSVQENHVCPMDSHCPLHTAGGSSRMGRDFRVDVDCQDQDRLFFPDEVVMELDSNMADLLQGSNFDDLVHMFGQQYPSF
ncbi:hypothetical protein EYZ11_001144 [Aspergillus tanneri]|nr:hypothetical protein EYZ11_001144 [Aspergillus tanneri]